MRFPTKLPWRNVSLLCLPVFGMVSSGLSAEEITIAVAANFRAPLEAIVAGFESASGHQVAIASGSTGQLYAQIRSGAPFDLLLAADQERPRRLADEGFGDRVSIFTYAVGRLALWSKARDAIGPDSLDRLGDSDFRWLAIAEPELAPYGRAARETLETLGVWDRLGSRLVRGQNVSQAFAMVATGSAELGLIALSQALTYQPAGSYLIVPETAHEPIRQDAIVLNRGAENPAAAAFTRYLREAPAAARIIESYGYLRAGDRHGGLVTD